MQKIAGDLPSIYAMSFSYRRYPFLLGLGTTFAKLTLIFVRFTGSLYCPMPWFVVCRLYVVVLDPKEVGGGGGILPYKRLMGMCRLMGSQCHDWIDYNGLHFQ